MSSPRLPFIGHVNVMVRAGDSPAYPARVVPMGSQYRWNGWLRPQFTREITERIANDVNEADGWTRFAWNAESPDVLNEYDEFHPDEPDYYYTPARPSLQTIQWPILEGLYEMGNGWCWELVESSVEYDPEIAGEIAEEGDELTLDRLDEIIATHHEDCGGWGPDSCVTCSRLFDLRAELNV